jgi:hypothetical protein
MRYYNSYKNNVYIRRVLRIMAEKQTKEFFLIRSSLFLLNITCSVIAGNVIGNIIGNIHK